jgi:hypothetical protein
MAKETAELDEELASGFGLGLREVRRHGRARPVVAGGGDAREEAHPHPADAAEVHGAAGRDLREAVVDALALRVRRAEGSTRRMRAAGP